MKNIFCFIVCLYVILSFPIDAADLSRTPAGASTQEKTESSFVRNEDLSAKDFLKIARKAPASESWAKMEGYATHRRTGAKAIKDNIRIGIRFTSKRITAQIFFADKEFYELGQTFDVIPVFTKDFSEKDITKSRIAMYGIDPSDITLAFLYREFVREEKSEAVKTFPCRVFVLKDKNTNGYVRVWLSTEYCFPLKVHWFNKSPEKNDKPIREMELGGVKKEDGFYVVSELLLFGTNWRTRIEFEKRSAGLVTENQKSPKDLFLDRDAVLKKIKQEKILKEKTSETNQ